MASSTGDTSKSGSDDHGKGKGKADDASDEPLITSTPVPQPGAGGFTFPPLVTAANNAAASSSHTIAPSPFHFGAAPPTHATVAGVPVQEYRDGLPVDPTPPTPAWYTGDVVGSLLGTGGFQSGKGLEYSYRNGLYTKYNAREQHRLDVIPKIVNGAVHGFQVEHIRLPRRFPLLKQNTRRAKEEGIWNVGTRSQVKEWLGLFYDLSFAAVLQIYGQSHQAIHIWLDVPTFLTYFVAVHWIWAEQVHYDVLYEQDDRYHWLLKGVQVILSAYMGSAGYGWSPFTMKSNTQLVGATPGDQVHAGIALQSFTTFTVTYALYNAILGIQYLVAYTYLTEPRYSFKNDRTMLASLIASAFFSAMAAGLPVYTTALVDVKLTFLFIALAIPMIAQAATQYWSKPHRTDAFLEGLFARYGGLSILILGEGLINVLITASQSINSIYKIGIETYGQLGIALTLTYLIWGMLFQEYEREGAVSTAGHYTGVNEIPSLPWKLVHYPLHCAMLLMSIASANVVRSATSAHVTSQIDAAWTAVTEVTVTGGGVLDPSLVFSYSKTIGRMASTNFAANYEKVQERAGVKNDSASSPAFEPFVWIDAPVLVQYFRLQDTYNALSTLGLSLSDGASNDYEEYLSMFNSVTAASPSAIASLNSTISGNVSKRQHATELSDRTLSNLRSEAVVGIRWLFPTAGATLILAALRSRIRYKHSDWLFETVQALQAVAGLVLCLLTAISTSTGSVTYVFRDGVNTSSLSKMITLAVTGWAHSIVLVCYVIANIVPQLLVSVVSNRRYKRAMQKRIDFITKETAEAEAALETADLRFEREKAELAAEKALLPPLKLLVPTPLVPATPTTVVPTPLVVGTTTTAQPTVGITTTPEPVVASTTTLEPVVRTTSPGPIVATTTKSIVCGGSHDGS